MKNKKLQLYFKILIAFIFGFFLSSFLIQKIFLAGTPKIRPNAFSNLALEIKNNTHSLIALFIKQHSPKEVLKDVPLKKISKGVYGKTRGNYSYTLIKTDEIEWKEYTFNINGKEIKIKAPKDQEPPSQKFMEALYK
jgi:hypothetical protein